MADGVDLPQLVFPILRPPGTAFGSLGNPETISQHRHSYEQAVSKTPQQIFPSAPAVVPREISFADYHPVPFQEGVLRGSRKKLITAEELQIVQAFLGKHSAQFVYQTGKSKSDRITFLMGDGQALQMSGSDPEKLVQGEIIHFRRPMLNSNHVRAMIDIFERDGQPIDINTLRVTGSKNFVRNMKYELAKESERRADILLQQSAAARDQYASAHATAISSGTILVGTPEDRVSKTNLELIDKVTAAITSGTLTSQQMSAAYREFEPWGCSAPITTQPNWNKLAVITGVIAAPQPQPAARPTSQQQPRQTTVGPYYPGAPRA
jgi:hypothetical protein